MSRCFKFCVHNGKSCGRTTLDVFWTPSHLLLSPLLGIAPCCWSHSQMIDKACDPFFLPFGDHRLFAITSMECASITDIRFVLHFVLLVFGVCFSPPGKYISDRFPKACLSRDNRAGAFDTTLIISSYFCFVIFSFHSEQERSFL